MKIANTARLPPSIPARGADDGRLTGRVDVKREFSIDFSSPSGSTNLRHKERKMMEIWNDFLYNGIFYTLIVPLELLSINKTIIHGMH